MTSSVIGLYYYLRFIFAMMRTDGENFPIHTHKSYAHLNGLLVVTLLSATILWLGVFPAWLINVIKAIT